MPPTTGLLTAEQLLADPARYARGELVAGVFHPMTPTAGAHGIINVNLLMALGAHVLPRSAGRLFTESTGFRLKRRPDTIRCPDVAFVAAERLPAAGLPQRGFLDLAPDIAAEVLSPDDSASEVSAKLDEFVQAGVRLVWIVDAATRTVTAHTPDGAVRHSREGDALDGGAVLPDFRCAVDALFVGVARE